LAELDIEIHNTPNCISLSALFTLLCKLIAWGIGSTYGTSKNPPSFIDENKEVFRYQKDNNNGRIEIKKQLPLIFVWGEREINVVSNDALKINIFQSKFPLIVLSPICWELLVVRLSNKIYIVIKIIVYLEKSQKGDRHFSINILDVTLFENIFISKIRLILTAWNDIMEWSGINAYAGDENIWTVPEIRKQSGSIFVSLKEQTEICLMV